MSSTLSMVQGEFVHEFCIFGCSLYIRVFSLQAVSAVLHDKAFELGTLTCFVP